MRLLKCDGGRRRGAGGGGWREGRRGKVGGRVRERGREGGGFCVCDFVCANALDHAVCVSVLCMLHV